LMFVFAGSVPQFIGARAFSGSIGLVGGAAQFPLMSDYYASNVRARTFAYLAAAGMAGSAITPPIIGFIVLKYGWRSPAFITAVFAFFVSLSTLLLKEPVRGGVDRLEMGATAEQAAKPQEAPSFQEALRAGWAIKSLRLQAIAGFVRGLGMGPLLTIVGLILAGKFVLDPFQRSLVATLTATVSIPLLIISAPLADRILAKRPATVVVFQAGMTIFIGVGYIIMGFAPWLWMFIAFQVITTGLLALVTTASMVLTSLVVPARLRATGMAVFSPFEIVGGLLGIPLTALAMRSSLSAALVLFGPVMMIGGLIYLASAATVASDIRRARAAAMAREEVEVSEREKRSKILVIRDLDVAYDDVQILFNLDLDVREGEILALVGTNGSGKSTLLRAIQGLQPARNGAIFFDGRNVTEAPPHENAQRGIVYMPGGQGVFPGMTVEDNLKTAAWTRRDDDAAVAQDLENLYEVFPRIKERLQALAGSLSGGEQQMVALAQAFLMRPRLLMIDELSLGLAPAVVGQLLDTVREMRDSGMSIILVEQSLNVAFTVADRAVFLDKGTVQFDGPTDQLLARPDLVRAVFMGGAASGGGALMAARKRLGAPADNQPLLTVSGISVTFGGVDALSSVDMVVKPGEVVGIIGPNGAGKTTLFDIISGYVTPSAGQVFVRDSDVTAMRPDERARLGLGRAFQNAKLFPPLTVRENIAVALERRANKNPILAAVWAPNLRKAEGKLRERIDGYIELLGLGLYQDKFVRELSTGTRRAVEVACQMAAEPDMLLLDEPSSGLAQAETEALGPTLLRIVRETGCGMLVIEHDLPLISGMSDRLIAMDLGRVLTTGKPDDVLQDRLVLESYLSASSDVIERSGSRVGSVMDTITSKTNSKTTTKTSIKKPGA
jgi:ABC-type branched-subunit amino acid transport system ATPase component